MIPVLLDCDPGNDDALAILAALGAPCLGSKAVTTGAGQLAADSSARNAAPRSCCTRSRRSSDLGCSSRPRCRSTVRWPCCPGSRTWPAPCPARVDVEFAGRHTCGRTVVHFAARTGLPPNRDGAIAFDAASRRACVAALAA